MISVRLQDASIVDPFWAPGFFLVALTYAWVGGPVHSRALLSTGLVLMWALRLGLHLLRRNLSHGEDARYTAMRDRHGQRFAMVSLFTVFWLQALLLWIISAPLLGSVLGRGPLGIWDVLGTVTFLVGFGLEAVADRQLRRFRQRAGSQGKVLDTGLWRYSRHPNYFGNAVLWWGLYLIAVGAGAAWSFVGPLLMTFLLLKVSGVALLERGLRRTRPEYAAYVRRTSAFVPWPPKA